MRENNLMAKVQSPLSAAAVAARRANDRERLPCRGIGEPAPASVRAAYFAKENL